MSKVITNKLKEAITREVGLLLVRGKTANPCPLSAEEVQLAWNAAIDKPVFRALEELEQAGYDTSYLKYNNARASILIHDKTYLVRFPMSLYDRPELSGGAANNFDSCWPLGEEKLLSFLDWVQNAGQINYEFDNAQWVVNKLLEYCKTVGQLTRAMPDLVNFMPSEIRKELREQRRSSTMPYEWAAFPRDKVDAAQLALAKAHLLPQTLRREWGNLHAIWAVIVKP